MDNSLATLYNLRTDFLVLGLTGRLGSGCTTVANLLSKDNFIDCRFPLPLNRDFKSNEERKYRIIHTFMESNWNSFTVIRASDIITAIVLENKLDEVVEFLSIQYNKDIESIRLLFEKNIKNGNTTIADEFEILHEERLAIKAIDDKNGTDEERKQKKELAYKFYVGDKRLSNFSESLKDSLINQLKSDNKSSPYQYFGDNIRKSGNALKEEGDSSNCYRIPTIINKIIKTIRNKNRSTNKPSWIVIDSIRNSLEAFYFKERFSAFYLFAINTESEHRYKRLEHNYNKRELERLDQEYDADVSATEKFFKQDIKSCIQSSDIYLYNPTGPENSGDTQERLKRDLIRYLALIFQPGIITPTPTERCMQIAYTAKYNSGCISRQVGAVVTDNSFSVKSIGWNNTAEGQTPCLLRNVEDLLNNSDNTAFSEYEKGEKVRKIIDITYPQNEAAKKDRGINLKGRNISFCFKECQNSIDEEKNQVHTRSLHAEENAMLQISKYGGEGLKNGFLFTTASPCELCSKKAYQLGISRVYYIDPYPGIAQQQIMNSGEEKHQPQLMLFSGAIGRAYHQLFEPFMAYKDELKIRLSYNYSKSSEIVIKRDEAAKEKYRLKLERKKLEIEKKLRDIDSE